VTGPLLDQDFMTSQTKTLVSGKTTGKYKQTCLFMPRWSHAAQIHPDRMTNQTHA